MDALVPELCFHRKSFEAGRDCLMLSRESFRQSPLLITTPGRQGINPFPRPFIHRDHLPLLNSRHTSAPRPISNHKTMYRLPHNWRFTQSTFLGIIVLYTSSRKYFFTLQSLEYQICSRIKLWRSKHRSICQQVLIRCF